MIPKIPHYSMTAPGSIYDEEALTALELAARSAKKTNDCVEAFNELERATGDHLEAQDKAIPVKVEESVNEHIKNGDFDDQIGRHLDNLNERVDNLLEVQTDGDPSTYGYELADVRIDYKGQNHNTAGDAVRSMSEKAIENFEATIKRGSRTINMLNPYTCKKATGITTATGEETPNVNQWTSDYIEVKEGEIYLANVAPYKVCVYDSNKQLINVVGYGHTTAANEKYMRVSYDIGTVPFEDRFGLCVSKYGSPNVPYLLPEGVNPVDDLTAKQWTGAPFLRSDFTRGSLSPYEDTVNKEVILRIGSGGTKRLCVNYPFLLLKGSVIACGDHNVRLYESDKDRHSFDVLAQFKGETFTVPRDVWVMMSIEHSSAQDLTEAMEAEIVNDLRITHPVEAGGSSEPVAAVAPIPEVPLSLYWRFALEHSNLSDHCFMKRYDTNNVELVTFPPADSSNMKRAQRYIVDPASKQVTKSYTYPLGSFHFNTVDAFQHGTDSVVMWTSANADNATPCKLYTASGATGLWDNAGFWQDYEIDVSSFGSKVQAIFGDDHRASAPNNDYGIETVYLIANNMKDVYRVLMHTNQVILDGGGSTNPYAGTFTVLNHWHTDVDLDVNQGSTFYNGKIYCGIGHEKIKVLEITLNTDGTMSHRYMIEHRYNPFTNSEITDTFTEGVTIKDGYMYVGSSDGYMNVYKL